MKPREWWIGKYTDQLMRRAPMGDVERGLCIHVIEKSAYDELLHRAAALAVDLEAAVPDIKLKSLREFEALVKEHVGGS